MTTLLHTDLSKLQEEVMSRYKQKWAALGSPFLH